MANCRARKALTVRPGVEAPAYEVGYGKPPVHTRFKKGKSGNPRGRPKGARSKASSLPALNEERMKTVILEEAYREILVHDGDRQVRIPVIKAILRTLGLQALKGNQRSQRMYTDLVQWVETANKALHDEWLKTAIEYKTSWEEAFRHGYNGPEPLPHPNDVVINMRTGQVEIHGPMTKEEKVWWDEARAFKQECIEEIAIWEKLVREHPESESYRKILATERQNLARISKVITD